MDVPEAREALDDAVRRVGSIALVHETLSQSFDENVNFDDIADRLLREVAGGDGDGVRRLSASARSVDSRRASPRRWRWC